ncbi:hypothetical protein EV715DRAFT_248256 [Schizophyllum commune]
MRQFYALTIYPLAALWLASSNTHHLLAVVVRHRHGMDTTALNPPRSVALPGSPLMLAPQGASVPSTYKSPRYEVRWPSSAHPHRRLVLLYCATIYLMGLRRHTARTLVVGVGMRTRLCRVVVVATLRPTD